MASIPTKYEGVQFRSRLEARWAAFFDLLGWKWEYEPIDLAGYIPDFVITKSLHYVDRRIVEVKPIVGLDQDVRKAKRKIEKSGWRGAAMIVGASMFPYPDDIDVVEGGSIRIGHHGYIRDDGSSWWDVLTLGGTDSDALVDSHFTHEDHSSCGDRYRAFESKAIAAWREAGNLVQWRGVSATRYATQPRHTGPILPAPAVASFFGNLAEMLEDD